MLKALADGETNPAALAVLADKQLRATPEQLCDALGACTELNPVYRQLLKMALEQLQFLEQHIGQLDQEIASLLRQHQVPGRTTEFPFEQSSWKVIFDPARHTKKKAAPKEAAFHHSYLDGG
jgi:hypothetical protein